jgi:hypothetical protein
LFYYDIHGCAWDIIFFHQTVYKSIDIRILMCTLLSPHIVGFIKWICISKEYSKCQFYVAGISIIKFTHLSAKNIEVWLTCTQMWITFIFVEKKKGTFAFSLQVLITLTWKNDMFFSLLFFCFVLRNVNFDHFAGCKTDARIFQIGVL